MSDVTAKKCPYCAEEIRAEAVKCKYCGSLIGESWLSRHLTQPWYRSRSGKIFAGVCMGLARQFGISVSIVRLAIILATLIGGWGVIVYVALWFIMPLEPFVPQYDSAGSPNPS